MAGRGTVQLVDHPTHRRDALVVKWRGEADATAALGDPVTSTSYELCVTDALGRRFAAVSLPSGGRCLGRPCWTRLRDQAYRYTDTNGLRGGIIRAVVRRSRGGRVFIAIAGRGRRLNAPALPVALPVVVRLSASTGMCWAGVLTPADVRANTGSRFRAAPRNAR
jgi:hypothetical protein